MGGKKKGDLFIFVVTRVKKLLPSKILEQQELLGKLLYSYSEEIEFIPIYSGVWKIILEASGTQRES